MLVTANSSSASSLSELPRSLAPSEVSLSSWPCCDNHAARRCRFSCRLGLRLSCGKWQNVQLCPFWQRPFAKKLHRLQLPLACSADPADGNRTAPAAPSAAAAAVVGVFQEVLVGLCAGNVPARSPAAATSCSTKRSACANLRPGVCFAVAIKFSEPQQRLSTKAAVHGFFSFPAWMDSLVFLSSDAQSLLTTLVISPRIGRLSVSVLEAGLAVVDACEDSGVP